MIRVLLVGLGGALGSILRYHIVLGIGAVFAGRGLARGVFGAPA